MTEYQQQLITPITHDQFIQAVFSGRDHNPYVRVTIRPVELKQGQMLQFSYWVGKQDVVTNVARGEDATAILIDLFPHPWKSITVQTRAATLTVQFSKKGKAILHRHQTETPRPTPEPSHDRPKETLLSPETSADFLQALGMMTTEGRIKADYQRKFRQINQFLQLITTTIDLKTLIESNNQYTNTPITLHLVEFRLCAVPRRHRCRSQERPKKPWDIRRSRASDCGGHNRTLTAWPAER